MLQTEVVPVRKIVNQVNGVRRMFNIDSIHIFLDTFTANLRGNVDDVGVVFKRSFAFGECDHILHHSCHFLGDEDQIVSGIFESVHFVNQFHFLFVEIFNLWK